jgi:hypothetical protein
MSVNWIEVNRNSPGGGRDLAPQNRAEARDSAIGLVVQGINDVGFNRAVNRELDRLKRSAGIILRGHSSGGVVGVVVYSVWTEFMSGTQHYRVLASSISGMRVWQRPVQGINHYTNTPQMEPTWGEPGHTQNARRFFWGTSS